MNSPSKRNARIAGATLFILALAWQQIEATRLGYAVEKSRNQEHILRGRIGALQMELEICVSPAQLAQAARVKLGMQPASPETLRILGENADASAPATFLSRLFSSWSLRKQGLDT